jgi:hypothetical protein
MKEYFTNLNKESSKETGLNAYVDGLETLRELRNAAPRTPHQMSLCRNISQLAFLA